VTGATPSVGGPSPQATLEVVDEFYRENSGMDEITVEGASIGGLKQPPRDQSPDCVSVFYEHHIIPHGRSMNRDIFTCVRCNLPPISQRAPNTEKRVKLKRGRSRSTIVPPPSDLCPQTEAKGTRLMEPRGHARKLLIAKVLGK